MPVTCTPDFHGYDYHAWDFNTAADFPVFFNNYIFSLFTRYFIENDSYKDINQAGLLERYMAVFGYELDMEVVPTLGCYLDIIDARICEQKYLIHISDVLGNPPDIFKDETIYRNLLRYVISVYKIKGTKGAYELFFSILGFGVNIIELPVLNVEASYDSGGEYDKPGEESVYDQSRCQTCSFYDVEFYPLVGGLTLIDPTTLSKLRSVVFFNEPINAKLRNFTSSSIIEDEFKIGITEENSELIEAVKPYDDGTEYEDGTSRTYDDIFTIGGTPIIAPVTIMVTEPAPSKPEIKISIENVFTPSALYLEKTTTEVRLYDGSGNKVYEAAGPIGAITETGIFINNTLLTNRVIPNWAYAKIRLRLVISPNPTGTAYVDITVGPNSTTVKEAYFI